MAKPGVGETNPNHNVIASNFVSQTGGVRSNHASVRLMDCAQRREWGPHTQRMVDWQL